MRGHPRLCLAETKAGVWHLLVPPPRPHIPREAFYSQEMQQVFPEQRQHPVLESAELGSDLSWVLTSYVPWAKGPPTHGGPEQPWHPHFSSVISWPVAVETPGTAVCPPPGQVRPGATLTLSVLLLTLSALSPLPFPLPLGCYLAFMSGGWAGGGAGAGPGKFSILVNYSR